MQINEAMFLGSGGWVAKPGKMMRTGMGGQQGRKVKFIGEIVGISSCGFYFPPGTFQARSLLMLLVI
jgi:hypothetical protein